MSVQYPIFIVSGVSGTGKTSAIPALHELLPGWNVFDKDTILCENQETFNAAKPYAHCIWLRIAQDVSESCLPLLIRGAFSEQEFRSCRTRDNFKIHWVHLDCEETILRCRLRKRDISEEDHNAILRDASGRLEEHNGLGSHIIDVSNCSPVDLAKQVYDWAKPIWEEYCRK